MKQSNIFKPRLKFSQKTSRSIFVLFDYDMYGTYVSMYHTYNHAGVVDSLS